METPTWLGNHKLLKRKEVIGFFASRHTVPGSVLPTLDWAHAMERRDDATVMSGFQSPMEREVLDILLQGQCGIAMVLNRKIYSQIPPRFRQAYDAQRLLFLSLENSSMRPSTIQAAHRNEYIASCATTLVFSSVTPTSSLYPLTQSHPTPPILLL
ncbi:MAG: hypothetical protein LIP02_14560 [Bacteroidales bacterium]|nr:hypothetical protein [Bacteroidales bacterium]